MAITSLSGATCALTSTLIVGRTAKNGIIHETISHGTATKPITSTVKMISATSASSLWLKPCSASMRVK